MQEIFNKVEQNQLQRTKNVGKFLNAAKTISISAGSISNRAEMTCGTPPTVKLGVEWWMIVSYMPKGQWLIRCSCPIIGRVIMDFLQILAILPSSLRCPPNNPREGSRAVFPLRSLLFKKDNETEKCLIAGSLWRVQLLLKTANLLAVKIVLLDFW